MTSWREIEILLLEKESILEEIEDTHFVIEESTLRLENLEKDLKKITKKLENFNEKF